MKPANTSQAEAGPSSSRRAQPVRQTRTNPPRSQAGPDRLSSSRKDSQNHDQEIPIFPAITHFTDAITALPKDLVRHFTLLKEVDAKIFAPEESLVVLVDAVLKSSPPEPRQPNETSSSVAAVSTPVSMQNNALHGNQPYPPSAPSADENTAVAVYDPSNIPRRQLVRQTSLKIQEMLVSLEEKNHVISTANDALSKHLSRIGHVWPHVETEFTDEAKWGSTTHWAYPENRSGRAGQTERSRRDGAATITAAAQQLAEEAAARSDARKQALQAKKGARNQHNHQESDMDDVDNHKQRAESGRKGQTTGNSKARKTAPEPSNAVGLGITAASSTNGNPPAKRRKVETSKAANGGQPMERSISSALGGNAAKGKTSSPRSTPAPDGPKKRKALPTTNGAAKKNKPNAGPAAPSPSIIPSPALPNLPDPKVLNKASPTPSVVPTAVPPPVVPPPAPAPRPAPARARGNSIQASVENGRQRPPSSASNKQNVPPALTPDVNSNGPRQANDGKPTKDSSTTIKTENTKDETPKPPPRAQSTASNGKKENSNGKADDTEPKPETPQGASTQSTTVVTTKSGRASKPSTPALGSFPDPTPRSRNARNNSAGATKRSHKKGASQQMSIRPPVRDEDANSSNQDEEDGEIDANEPRYCYCNNVSYGEMVACDADDCQREWFHLDCVGLKAAPGANTKWYCDNCKNGIKAGKKVNGR